MKKIIVLFAVAFLATALPVFETGCSTPSSARNVQYSTLKAVGETADAAVALSAHLYQQHVITPAQANQVRDLYDLKFQPAYRFAVNAARADLSTLASQDLMALAGQLSSLVVQFQNKPSS